MKTFRSGLFKGNYEEGSMGKLGRKSIIFKERFLSVEYHVLQLIYVEYRLNWSVSVVRLHENGPVLGENVPYLTASFQLQSDTLDVPSRIG